jgi:hypothetical protein
VIVSEHAFRELALTLHSKVAHFSAVLYDISCGKELRKFLAVIGSLWILAVIGETCSFTTLLYVGKYRWDTEFQQVKNKIRT